MVLKICFVHSILDLSTIRVCSDECCKLLQPEMTEPSKGVPAVDVAVTPRAKSVWCPSQALKPYSQLHTGTCGVGSGTAMGGWTAMFRAVCKCLRRSRVQIPEAFNEKAQGRTETHSQKRVFWTLYADPTSIPHNLQPNSQPTQHHPLSHVVTSSEKRDASAPL